MIKYVLLYGTITQIHSLLEINEKGFGDQIQELYYDNNNKSYRGIKREYR